MWSLDLVPAIPLPPFEGGFGFTPWETAVQFSPAPQSQPPNPAQAQTPPAATPRSSGSEEPSSDRAEERRIRRMISNRDSARRSRKRKQRHMEDLGGQVDRLKSENRGLADQLVATTGHCLLFCRDNHRLRSEAAALRRRLHDVRRVLILRYLQCSLAAPPPPPPQALLEQLSVYGGG